MPMNILTQAQLSFTKIAQIGAGQGVNSQVFRVHDPQLGGEMVIKEVLKSRFGNTPAGYFVEAQAMFAAEHAHVVPVRYACETASHVCIGMPFYQKGSLTDRIDKAPISLSEVIRLGEGVLTGLTR